MKVTTKTLKQFFLVLGITIMALLLANMGGLTALAQTGGPISDEDCPAFLNLLNACQGGLRGVVLLIINFFLGFLGLLAVIMVIYGGFLYVTSAGNEENVNKAKKILLYAVVGIIVIILSFVLVRTILGAAVGTDR